MTDPTDNTARLEYSDDGGRTWAYADAIKIVEDGNYRRRLRFTQLGMGDDRRFRLTISGPYAVPMLGIVYVETSA